MKVSWLDKPALVSHDSSSESNVRSGLRVHSCFAKSEASFCLILMFKSARKLLDEQPATVDLCSCPNAVHDVSRDSLFTAMELTALNPRLARLAKESLTILSSLHWSEGLDECNYRVDPRTGWRFYPSSRMTPSSSSSHWEQNNDWKSNRSWDSWRTSSSARHVLHFAVPSSFSPLLVLRSEKHCHDPRPQQRGTSAELPPLAGYQPHRIVDDRNNKHFTEDGQFTELEDLRVKPLSYHQSITASTCDSAEGIATPPEGDFDDEQLRTLLA